MNPILVCITIFIGFTSVIKSEGSETIHKYVCYDSMLDLQCNNNEVLLFESARYGRNDTKIASVCGTFYQHTCDFDVHFPLNRMCSGRIACHLPINANIFDDPCGYEEFLKISYKCVPSSFINGQCQASYAPALLLKGYISTPNYPNKYYMNADCVWTITVQPEQKIQVTIYDFELDVKRGGKCYDYLKITSDAEYFYDCGGIGKQVIVIKTHTAEIQFRAGHTGLTKRGFFLYFEGIEGGCYDLEANNSLIDYTIIENEMIAKVSCIPHHFITGTVVTKKFLHCINSSWNDTIIDCAEKIESITPAPPLLEVPYASVVPIQDESNIQIPIIGIALGIISTFLLISLVVVLSLYLRKRCTEQKRRWATERKLDEMRVVFNNLSENAINGSMQCVETDPWGNSIQRMTSRKKNHNFNEDDMMGANLLNPPLMDNEYEFRKTSNIPANKSRNNYMYLPVGSSHYGIVSPKSIDNSPKYKSIKQTQIYDKPARPMLNDQAYKPSNNAWNSPEETGPIYSPVIASVRLSAKSEPDILSGFSNNTNSYYDCALCKLNPSDSLRSSRSPTVNYNRIKSKSLSRDRLS